MKTLYESLLDDPQIITKSLDEVSENPFKYLARLGSDVWEDKTKIRNAFELFRTAITNDCKIKQGDKASSEKYKIAFKLDSEDPEIYIKCGPYTRHICQSYRGKHGRYLSLLEIGKRYAAKHFQNCMVYIPSKKLIEQYLEFKHVMGQALTTYDGINDLNTLNEYIKVS